MTQERKIRFFRELNRPIFFFHRRSTQNHLNSIKEEKKKKKNRSLLKENYCVILIEIFPTIEREARCLKYLFACMLRNWKGKSNIDQRKIE